jgi:hypothetical protein
VSTKEPELITPKNAPAATEPKTTEAPKTTAKDPSTHHVTVKANLVHPTTGELIAYGESAHIPHADATAWIANNLAESNETGD